MNYHYEKLKSGLYLVATPLGSARDITLRALDVLHSCDAIVAEDTRLMRKLLNIHNISINGRPLFSYNDFNGDRVRPKILSLLSLNKAVAYASDAGMPLIADPGYQLSKQAAERGFYVTSVPVLNRFLYLQIWPAEAPTSISRRLDAAGVHSSNSRELLDVPHASQIS